MIDYVIDIGGKLVAVFETDPRRITSIYPESAAINLDLLADCIHILPG